MNRQWGKSFHEAPIKVLRRKRNKRQKTNKIRFYPKKKKGPVFVLYIHICFLHFTERRHVLGRHGALTYFCASAEVTFRRPPHFLPQPRRKKRAKFVFCTRVDMSRVRRGALDANREATIREPPLFGNQSLPMD